MSKELEAALAEMGIELTPRHLRDLRTFTISHSDVERAINFMSMVIPNTEKHEWLGNEVLILHMRTQQRLLVYPSAALAEWWFDIHLLESVDE